MRLPLLQIYRDTLEVAFLEHFRKIILYNTALPLLVTILRQRGVHLTDSKQTGVEVHHSEKGH